MTPMEQYHIMKCIIIGDVSCGKTCITKRFTEDVFDDDHKITIGVDFATTTLRVNNKLIKIQIWDTAGQETFLSITKTYYKHVHMCIIVYDVTNRESYRNVLRWYKEVVNNCLEKDVHIMIIGNKIDLRDESNSMHVSTEEADGFSCRHNFSFMETSAKNATNIDDMFYVLTKGYVDKYGLEHIKSVPNSLIIHGENRVGVDSCT